MAGIFAELKRRNVFRVAVAYLVIGWLLLQIADLLFDTLGLGDGPKKLILGILALGFLPTLLFSWAFELTPEGIKREKDIERDQSITTHTAKKLDLITLFAVVLLLGMVIWQQFQPKLTPSVGNQQALTNQKATEEAFVDTPQHKESKEDASIAVLPFADLSAEGNQEYFSDGIAEEILNVLVKVEGLNVSSRTSSFQFKGRDIGIPQIAKQLKVRHVLEGSVRKAGNNIRITAQLIEADTDKHLWSETYDRPLTTENIFAIQDEISKSIVEALTAHLGISIEQNIVVKISTNNLTAYELYLKARPLFLSRLNLDVADNLIEQAVTLDPNFSQAWEVRAALQFLMGAYNYTEMTVEQQKKKLFEYADIALALEPNSAMAIASKALAHSDDLLNKNAKADINQIVTDFKTALKIEPKNGSALNWYGLLLQTMGFLEQALDNFELCMKYEPYYTPCVENSIGILSELGRDNEVMALLLNSLNQGVLRIDALPLSTLARLDMEVMFKLATNQDALLRGWPGHDKLYQAFKNPEKNHQPLLMDIEQYLKSKPAKIAQNIDIMLNPLGREPQVSTIGMWGRQNHRGRQKVGFKEFIKNSGIYEFWQANGFPSQCRPLDNNDFECD